MSGMPLPIEAIPVVECAGCPFYETLGVAVGGVSDDGTWAETIEPMGVCHRADNRTVPDNLAVPPAWCPLRQRLTIIAVVSRIVGA